MPKPKRGSVLSKLVSNQDNVATLRAPSKRTLLPTASWFVFFTTGFAMYSPRKRSSQVHSALLNFSDNLGGCYHHSYLYVSIARRVWRSQDGWLQAIFHTSNNSPLKCDVLLPNCGINPNSTRIYIYFVHPFAQRSIAQIRSMQRVRLAFSHQSSVSNRQNNRLAKTTWTISTKMYAEWYLSRLTFSLRAIWLISNLPSVKAEFIQWRRRKESQSALRQLHEKHRCDRKHNTIPRHGF